MRKETLIFHTKTIIHYVSDSIILKIMMSVAQIQSDVLSFFITCQEANRSSISLKS